MRRRTILIGAFLLLGAMPLASLRAASSASFDVSPADDAVSSGATISGPSFSIQGSLDTAGGRATSASFALESSLQTGASCGDGFVDPGEDCDHGDFDGASCASEGFDSGTLACATDCSFDVSACARATHGGGGGGGGGGGSTAAADGTGSEPAPEPEPAAYGTGDLNGDAVVDDYDLSLFVRSWGTSVASADLNRDGVVDDYDISIFITRWSVRRA